MADIQVANTDADLSDNTLLTEENAYTITGLHTFSRSTNAPFACISGAAVVTYLDADKLDGQEGAYYLAAANVTGTLAVGKGGTGATSLTDGGVLLGSGTAAITATAVLGDGVILIGDASGDPTTLDVGSSTAITILGTIATGVWQGDEIGVAYGGTGVTSLTDGGVLLGSGSGDITAMAVLADSEMIVGDGTGDPVAESGSDLRTSIGVGTGDSPQFTGLTISGTGASSLDIGGGLNAGTGDVALIGTDGKINGPLSSTIIDDLSGANLTTLSASNISSGTLANARLPSNVDLGGTLDVTGVTTLDDDLSVGATDFFVDDSEGKVGINTAAPEAKLHILVTDSGITPNANTHLFIEKGSNAQWIEFAAPNDVSEGGGILFSDTDAGGVGSINYNHSINKMQLGHDVAIGGALSKGSGSFNIDHPLPSKTDTHRLVHSFIEGPQCDLIYRGTATLSSGATAVNLDTASGMTEGTWVLLCRNEQCFTSNETGWTSVRGSVTGNILTIECEEGTSTDTISWMVVAERHDTHIMETDWTDEDGHVILEPEKPEEP
jgi:hypothetical protein